MRSFNTSKISSQFFVFSLVCLFSFSLIVNIQARTNVDQKFEMTWNGLQQAKGDIKKQDDVSSLALMDIYTGVQEQNWGNDELKPQVQPDVEKAKVEGLAPQQKNEKADQVWDLYQLI